MFGEYVGAALKRAEYIPLEDGTYAARVDGLRGVLATGPTVDALVKRLLERGEISITEGQETPS